MVKHDCSVYILLRLDKRLVVLVRGVCPSKPIGQPVYLPRRTILLQVHSHQPFIFHTTKLVLVVENMLKNDRQFRDSLTLWQHPEKIEMV